jgi:enamine deaminase RidA (YjgF/YER057c/UK114 family)
MAGENGEALPKTHSWPKGHWNWPIRLPYRHGLACGGLAFVGGQVSLDERGDVIDPERQDLQVRRSVANIDRVLAGLGMTAGRLIHFGAYFEQKDGRPLDDAAFSALRALQEGDCPALFAGFPNLSYPAMRVEIEAVAEVR